jgi:hypothetical protein
MIREGHENVEFFYGAEVEHTPAYGNYTLFVVGLQAIEDIAEALTCGNEPVDHIYFGANMSFPNPTVNDNTIWSPWETMIKFFLDKEYLCTLDVDNTSAEGLIESGLCEYNNFIPMISVKLPYLQQLGYNATIKLDDKDFDATNPGVWCHSLHDLKNRNNFTNWSKYTKDKIK